MCVVSMIGDEFSKRWSPWEQIPKQQPFAPTPTLEEYEKLLRPPVNRQEFEVLKREVELMRDLLKAAKIYDEKKNEPNCEMDEKIVLLKAVAKMMGVSLEGVFK